MTGTAAELFLIQRMPPAEPRETSEAAVERQPFATEFDGQGRVKSVRHEIAPSVASTAEIDENFPMTRARCQKMNLLPGTKIFQKIQGLKQRASAF